MTQTMEHAAGEPAAAPTPAVGEVLRQARADLRLSLEEAAQKLRLAPKQLRALENEQYDLLPGPTYIRGYLRGYAQLLGLTPENVIALYNRHPSAAKPVDLAKHTPTPQMGADHHVIKITSLIVAGLVLGLAAIWWQGRDDSPIKLRKPPVAALDETPAGADAREAAPETAARDAAGAPAEDRAVAERDAPRPAVAAPALAPPGPRPLVLHFEQDSWADVRDGAQNRLLYSVVSAGRVVRLGGTPPFNVYLGNASGVRVEFNGQAVDVSRHQRGPVARLTLGAATEAAP